MYFNYRGIFLAAGILCVLGAAVKAECTAPESILKCEDVCAKPECIDAVLTKFTFAGRHEFFNQIGSGKCDCLLAKMTVAQLQTIYTQALTYEHPTGKPLEDANAPRRTFARLAFPVVESVRKVLSAEVKAELREEKYLRTIALYQADRTSLLPLCAPQERLSVFYSPELLKDNTAICKAVEAIVKAPGVDAEKVNINQNNFASLRIHCMVPPKQLAADACFVADSLVASEKEEMTIEKVLAGEKTFLVEPISSSNVAIYIGIAVGAVVLIIVIVVAVIVVRRRRHNSF